jgi:hypothetical protein
VQCPRGFFCEQGIRSACAPGRFGYVVGLQTPACSGLCAPGFFCPDPANIQNKPIECGASNVYCPPGSTRPIPVPKGTYSTGGFEQTVGFSENTTRSNWENCPPGHFCSLGKLFQCPGGTWGNLTMETRPGCAGLCAAGYFCPPGSLSAKAFLCSDIFLEIPRVNGTLLPTRSAVEYTNAFDFTLMGGAVDGGQGGGGLSGAGQAWLMQLRKKSQLLQQFLTNGTSFTFTDDEANLIHLPGLTPESATNQLILIQQQSSYLSAGGLQENITIPWKSGQQVKLPHVDIKVGEYDLLGFRLRNGGSAVFCRPGTSWPAFVTSGHFTVGVSDPLNRTQTGERECPPGSYCVAGIQYPCAPGRYGSSSAEVSRFCSGVCPAGYACPMGSASPIECSDGTYSGGGMHTCSACPQDPPELQLRSKAIHEHTFGSANPYVDRDNLYKQKRCKTSRLCCGL